MKKTSIFLTIIMLIGTLAFPISSIADEEQNSDFSKIVNSVQMIDRNGKDQFGVGSIPFSDATLKIEISYNKNDFVNPIKKGDKLEIILKPESYDKDFMSMDYSTSNLNQLMDNKKNPPVKVADIDMKSRDGVKFTFTGESENFNSNLVLPFDAKKSAITKYFKDHPGETEVTFRYNLQINGKNVENKTLEYTIKKPTPGPSVRYFSKTSGTYNQQGNLGDGHFHYNIIFDTELRSPNEYVIYDLPDVNMGFDGELKIYDGESKQQLDDQIFNNYNTDPNGKYEWSKDNPNGTKVRVYDVYYVSKEPDAENQIRVPDWEEKNLHFDRDGEILDSQETASVPKNILFQKPLGSKLTPEEEKKIEENGGLYKKVGKGFKVRLTDYKSNYLTKGGHLTLVYRMKIKNPSPELNSIGQPIYKNFVTYYGQEIPNCKPGEECTPIKAEKTKASDNGSPEKPAVGVVKPGSIGADVTAPETEFTKVEADENNDPLMDKPVKGAKFTIYKSDKDGNKGEIANNRDGLALENLITDDKGKLTKDEKPVPLTLDKGYYLFYEIEAPENYEIIKRDKIVTVGYKANSVAIANKKKIISTYNAKYEFKAENASDVLPESVMNLLPVDTTKYKDGETVNAIQPKLKEVKVENGKWVFKGYDKNKETVKNEDVKFIGVWKYEKGEEPSNPHNSWKPSTPKNGSSTTTTEKIGTPSKTDVQNNVAPQTIDNANILTYIALAGLAGTLLITFNYRRKSN